MEYQRIANAILKLSGDNPEPDFVMRQAVIGVLMRAKKSFRRSSLEHEAKNLLSVIRKNPNATAVELENWLNILVVNVDLRKTGKHKPSKSFIRTVTKEKGAEFVRRYITFEDTDPEDEGEMEVLVNVENDMQELIISQ